jgi:hypothetical protein
MDRLIQYFKGNKIIEQYFPISSIFALTNVVLMYRFLSLCLFILLAACQGQGPSFLVKYQDPEEANNSVSGKQKFTPEQINEWVKKRFQLKGVDFGWEYSRTNLN